MIIAIFLISFALDGIMSNIFPIYSIFASLFTIVSLLIMYPYFNSDKTKFIVSAILLGLFYDIVYTNSLFINTFSFLLIAFIIMLIYNYITINKLNIIFINILIILSFQVISYILLCITGYTKFNDETLITGLYSCLISNVIYGYLLYFITLFLSKKYKIRKIV